MRLHRLRVEHVRGLPAAEVHFAVDGVTVVEAPNESGKTSLFDAFDLLLKEKHNTKKQTVKDLQPAGRDVGSVVEAELTVAGTHLTIRKSFNKDRSTELVVHTPAPRQLTGNEAHDELRRILDEGTDMALFEALRFHQGRSLDSIALADSEHLARRLDASAGGSGDTGDDALYERVAATFERYFTPTGQDGKELKEADAAVAEADQYVAELAATAAELASAGARATELQRERVRLQDAIATLGPQVEAHREQLRRVTGLRAERETASSERRAARSERDAAVAAAAARDDQVEAIERTRRRLKQREAIAATAKDAWQEQQARLQALADDLRDAEAREAAARAAVQGARAAADLGRRRTELRAARERHQRIQTALADAAAADAFLADHPLTTAQLDAVREAADDLRVVEARLGDAAPTVRILAERTTDLTVDGRPLTVAGGEAIAHQVPEQLLVAVEGAFSVQVRAGASLADRLADRDHARRALARACQRIGVRDRAEAEELERARETHLRTLAQRDAVIERELDGRTREQLADGIRLLESQVAELEARLVPADPPSATGTEEAADAVLGLEAAEEVARSATANARSEHQALTAEVARLRDIATEAGTAASHDRDELETACARLETSRATTPDPALQDAVDTATMALRHADERLATIQTELDALQPDEVELLAENAQQRQVRLAADLDQVREQAAEVRMLIEVRGGQGVGEALQAAEAERDRWHEARRSLRARAAAARALKEAFETARDAAYAAYREPLRRRIVQAGRLVFGEDLDVQLDEDLAVISRSLGGITLAFDRLSAGAREQLAILTALAAADLAGEDGVPLVLDDTLGYTDAGRLERLGAVLGRVRGPQVVVLTCVGDRFHAIGGARTVRLREVTAS
jgi:hypothetical protein